MPHARQCSKRGCVTRARPARTFSAKRNGLYKQDVVILSLHATAAKSASPPAAFGVRVERNAISPGNVTRRSILIAAAFLLGSRITAFASPCQFESQGEGRVAAIVDARGVRLDDGREIRFTGIEPTATTKRALTSLLVGRDVSLRGTDDTPDRYGRQPALMFVAESDTSVQAVLLAQGDALVSAEIADKDCAAALMAAEAEARRQKKGNWADPSAIKNAESPDDILAGIGRFVVVEGKVLSVRQAGATTYLNFGRNWTRGFAVTISRRIVPAFESAGVTLKSLENKRIRVRGWVEGTTGPRIDVLRVGQVELLGANEPGVRP